MNSVPAIVVIAIGVAGVAVMIVSFTLISRQGGWQNAMSPDPEGGWTLPRKLTLVGAVLCLVFVLLAAFVTPWQ